MECLGLLCDGKGKHDSHDVVAGHAPGTGSVSEYAGKYPIDFVKAVLNTVESFRDRKTHVLTDQPSECAVVEVLDDDTPPSMWDEVMAVGRHTEKSDAELLPVLSKLHRNLGHPPNCDLVRILKHGNASEQALRLAREFSCDFCKSQARPASPLPAQPHRVPEFNHQIAIDVKHLRGWLPNQKVKALNIVDSASGFQRMIPFFQAETAQGLRELLNEHWISWAGPPRELVLDPARTNLGAPMTAPAELDGTVVRPIAAGAHWQLGKCESHGGWFNRVLEKLVDDFSPQNKEQWLECVVQAHVKNQMLQIHGLSPCQFVFGRNPNIPQDLLNEPLAVVPATASLTDDAIQRTQAMRTTARMTLIQMQDDRALRVALLARPRRAMCFKAGDMVAYWRNQKWIQGQLQQGGQWYGVAIVLGHVGRNLVLVHRRQVIRCAPEQVRPATSEEKCLITTPDTELLGIKDMIEKGNLRSSQQYIDLLPQSYPPQEEDAQVPEKEDDRGNQAEPPVPVVAPPAHVPSVSPPMPAVRPSAEEATEPVAKNVVSAPETEEVASKSALQHPSEQTLDMPSSGQEASTSEASSSYGPVRRRISGKDGPFALRRPPALKQEDFVEVMREIVPQLVEDVCMNTSKRPLSPSEPQGEQPASRPRLEEALSAQDVSELSALADQGKWDCLIAEYLKKKMSKELPHSNNPPELQKKVQEGKRLEWETIASKPHSIRLHFGKRARQIREEQADRFIGSRFVLTCKPIEEGLDVDPDNYDSFTERPVVSSRPP